MLGTLAAIALARGALPGAPSIAAALVSPLMMPGLVLGIALLQYFRAIGFNATWSALLVAHVVVTLPYVARTMIAGDGAVRLHLDGGRAERSAAPTRRRYGG